MYNLSPVKRMSAHSKPCSNEVFGLVVVKFCVKWRKQTHDRVELLQDEQHLLPRLRIVSRCWCLPIPGVLPDKLNASKTGWQDERSK